MDLKDISFSVLFLTIFHVFHCYSISSRLCIGYPTTESAAKSWQSILGNSLFVYLKDVHHHTTSRGKLFGTHRAFKVFRFLVLLKNLFVLEVPITIVTVRFVLGLIGSGPLLSSHGACATFFLTEIEFSW